MSLKKEAIFHIGGSVAYALAQWSVLVLFSRLISIEAAGAYSYFLALFSPAAILTSFGVRNSIASDKDREHSIGTYRRAQQAGLLLLTAYYLAIISTTDGDLEIASLVFLIKLSDNLSEISYGSWVRSGSLYRYSVSKLSKLALFSALFCALYLMGFRANGVMFAYPLSIAAIYFLYDRRKEEKDDIRDKGFLNIMKLGIPLALGSFIISVNVSIPRISINHILDEQALAEFVMLTYFISFATLPITSICQAIIPRIPHNGVPKSTWLFFAAYSIGYFSFIIFLANPIIEIVYKTNASYSYTVLSMIGLAGVFHFMSTLLNAVLVANRQFAKILSSALISTVATATLSPLLIMKFSLTGASAAYLASSLTLFSFNAIYATQQNRKLTRALDSPA